MQITFLKTDNPEHYYFSTVNPNLPFVNALKKQNIPPHLPSRKAPSTENSVIYGPGWATAAEGVVCSYLCSLRHNHYITQQAATQYTNNDSATQWWSVLLRGNEDGVTK